MRVQTGIVVGALASVLVSLCGCGRAEEPSVSRSQLSLTDSTLQPCSGTGACPEGLGCTYFALPGGKQALCATPGSECDVASCSEGGRCITWLSDPGIVSCSDP